KTVAAPSLRQHRQQLLRFSLVAQDSVRCAEDSLRSARDDKGIVGDVSFQGQSNVVRGTCLGSPSFAGVRFRARSARDDARREKGESVEKIWLRSYPKGVP